MDGKAENLDNLTSELRSQVKTQIVRTLKSKFVDHGLDPLAPIDIQCNPQSNAITFTAVQHRTTPYSCVMNNLMLLPEDYADICNRIYISWVIPEFLPGNMNKINDYRNRYGNVNGLKFTTDPKGRFFIHFKEESWYLNPNTVIQFIEDRFQLSRKEPVCVGCGTEVSSICFRCAQHN